ncbi:pre-mrna-splicing factor spf27 homolog [Stylonychia lemnae]|uniref:Pre-mrna-splicing factor spf27 homolog n=1 Tax=Stylonychia lemnae TaxID=5949 RepID=A0A078B961_STYLE|nr:pre-mrna-splicing factor spf27 homolog [Stylonychia lemnae]|eukprot:CDW90914.1 pre-mrna-splicing factor spf27 homolog [Stylonychia lemnae]
MLEYQANYLVLQNENSRLVTALPYIDEAINESQKKQVNGLILQEMAAMDGQKDYLEKLPMPQFKYLHHRILLIWIPGDNLLIRQTSTFNMLKIGIRFAAYHNLNRRMNLELEKAYGKDVWTTHIKQTESQIEFTDQRNRKLDEEIERINKKRRFTQMNEYDNFLRLHNKTFSALHKNIDLEQECYKLEQEISQYQNQLQKIQVRLIYCKIMIEIG